MSTDRGEVGTLATTTAPLSDQMDTTLKTEEDQ
jgi:hypothetical protein